MSAPAAAPPVLLRLAPVYRRIGVYIVVGYAALVTVGVSREVLDANPRDWAAVAIGSAVAAVPIIGIAASLFRPVLRVDAAGIWCRWLYGWDLWSWADFADGQVRVGRYKDSYIRAAKRLRSRQLSLEFLAPAERAALADLIAGVWVPPPPALVPDDLSIRHDFRGRLHLSAEGVQAARGRFDDGVPVPWSEVVQVRVQPLDHTRRDFHRLELVLPPPHRLVRLYVDQGQLNWRGADAEVIRGFVERHAPAERIEITALNGPPRDAAEADRRRATLQRHGRELRRGGWLLAGVIAAANGWLLIGMVVRHGNPLNWPIDHWLSAVVLQALLGIMAALVGGVWLHARLRLRTAVAELDRWQAARPTALRDR